MEQLNYQSLNEGITNKFTKREKIMATIMALFFLVSIITYEFQDESTLYQLQLEDERIYVGISKNILRRVKEHESGKGSAYTKKWKMISVISTEQIPTRYQYFLETQLTCQLFLTKGVNKVRGAEFSQTKDFRYDDLPHLTSTCGHNLGLEYSCVRAKFLLSMFNGTISSSKCKPFGQIEND